MLNNTLIKPYSNLLSAQGGGNALIEYNLFFNKIIIQGDEHNNDITPTYQRILFAIEQHFSISDQLIINFNLSSIGVGSIKAVLNILRILSIKSMGGKYIKVNWFYNEADIEMIEAGTELSQIYHLDFSLISTRK